MNMCLIYHFMLTVFSLKTLKQTSKHGTACVLILGFLRGTLLAAVPLYAESIFCLLLLQLFPEAPAECTLPVFSSEHLLAS